jgi:tetratricopeptide (TPR) repeat protein
LTGRGVPKDEAEAVKWFLKAADQRNAQAQRLLGGCYADGSGVPKDEAEAVKWFLKAADQRNAQAQIFLGKCYSSGIGVPKNDDEAMKWYHHAAEQGNANAKVLLGGCYLIGNGVAKDAAKSLRLLLEGYNSLDVNDPNALGAAFLIGALYDGEVPGVENGEEASKWLQKVVDSGGENADEARRRLQKYKIYNAVNQLQQEAAKYLEKVEDETPNPIAGPPKQIVVTYMWGICKAGEVQSNDKSFTLQRGNTLRSKGFKGIPIGVELYPIRISGSQLQMTYYFYQDEFGDWKGVEK